MVQSTWCRLSGNRSNLISRGTCKFSSECLYSEVASLAEENACMPGPLRKDPLSRSRRRSYCYGHTHTNVPGKQIRWLCEALSESADRFRPNELTAGAPFTLC